MARKAVIALRFTAEQEEAIVQEAEAANLQPATYLYQVLCKRLRLPTAPVKRKERGAIDE